jgi:hypothetical protein
MLNHENDSADQIIIRILDDLFKTVILYALIDLDNIDRYQSALRSMWPAAIIISII